jgi:omega-6 fatty acid desaturase (delta-12 desaturase)
MSGVSTQSGFTAGLDDREFSKTETYNTTATSSATGTRQALAEFQTPSLSRSLLEAAMSFGGFIAVCAAMYLTIGISVWIAMPLALLAAGFLVRIFIIQHDCGHGSFFRSRQANRLVGWACSIITLAPYASWRRHHAGHHRMWNNLDRRGMGVDIYSSCMTVAEYRALSRFHRFLYRSVRNPLIQNLVLPPLVFLVLYRLPFDTDKTWSRERWGIQLTNIAIVGVVGGGALLFGWEVALVQLPIMILASIIGVWLFSVQHRFENSYWARQENWTPEQASIRGSSHLMLPKLLQWFTGNIGLHHIHHLNTRIPNYRLQNCHDSSPAMQCAPVLTFWQAIGQSRFALWDEARLKMVSFRQCRADQKAAA